MKTKHCYSLFTLLFVASGIFFASCTQQLNKPSAIPPNIDIENLLQEAFKLYHQGRFADASQKLETATQIVPKDPPTWSAAILYSMLAFFEEKSGDTAKATATYRVVEDLLGGVKSTEPESEPLGSKLMQFGRQLKGQDELQLLERLLPLAIKSQGKAGEALIINYIANVYLSLNNYQEALRRGEEALKLAKELGEESFEMPAIMTVSGSLISLGRAQEAESLLQEVFPKTEKDTKLKANILAQLGLVHAALGREDSAIQELQEAITIASSLGATDLVAFFHLKFRLAYFFLKKPQAGVKELTAALSLYEKLNYEISVASVEGWIAQDYFGIGAFEEANRHATRAAEIFNRLGNRIEEAKNLRLAGQSLWALNKIDDALKALEKAALIQVEEKDRDGVLQTLWAVVGLFKSAGRIEDAKQVLLMGLKSHASVFSNDVEAERMIRWELANVCKELGDLSEALDHFDKVFSIYNKLGDQKGKILALIEMAQIYAELNDYENRINFLSFAEKLGTEIDDPFIKLLVLTHTAALARDAGDTVEALQRYLEALKISRLVSKQAEMNLTGLVGHFYLSIGEHGKALSYFEDNLRIAKEIGDQIGIARCLNSIGHCYLSMNRYNDAINSAREAIEIIRATKNQMVRMVGFQELISEELQALGLISSALEYQQKHEDAFKVAQERFEVAEKSGKSVFIKDARNDLGRISLEMGKYTEAIQNFKEAIEEIEFLRWGITDQGHQMGFLVKQLSPHDGIIKAFYELHRKTSSSKSGFAEEALNYAERSKGRVWAEQLSKVRAGLIQESVPLEIQNEDKDLLNKFIAAYQEYQNARTHLGISAQEFKEKKEASDTAWGKWKRFKEKVQKRYPKYALLRYHTERPVQLSELTIKAEETHILYKVTTDWVYVWVVRRIGGQNKILNFVQLPSKTFEIEKTVEKLLSPFGRGKYKEFDIKISNELFDKILRPVLEAVEISKRLIIMPDGMLNILPFEVLATGTGCSNGMKSNCFFGDQYNISYYPSAAILTFNREAVPQTVPSQGSLFAVGDPIYGLDDCRLNKSQISFMQENEKKDKPEFTLRGSGFRKGLEDKGYTFDRLRHSGSEVQKISGVFENRTGDREVLIGLDASEGHIKSRDLTRYQYLHFAVHGILAFDVPYLNEPALVLAVDPDTKEDGFLTLSEIYGLKLNADLVTLSACRTGLGLRVSGEGVIGLTRAFINAGARSVLVSLWEVADESTALFMEEFYRQLAQGIDKVEALKKAKEYLRVKGYENPYFWAPFILIGD